MTAKVTPAKSLKRYQRALTTGEGTLVRRAAPGTPGLVERVVDWTEPIRVGGKGWTLVHFGDGTESKSPAGSSWWVL